MKRRDAIKTGLLGSIIFPGIQHFQSKSLKTVLPGNQELVKLNSNENPYGPSAKAKEAIIEAMASGNRYPRPAIRKLKKKIAGHEECNEDQVFVSAGTTELLGLAGLVFGLQGGNVISSHPTFDFLNVMAERFNSTWIKVPLKEDMQYNLDGIDAAINKDTKLVFICNPNNPTGLEINNRKLRAFVEKWAPTIPIYLDEAYIEFSSMGIDGSLRDLLPKYPNLMIARTFSKIYGLAGMRIGYCLGHSETISTFMQYHTGRMITPSVCSVYAAMASMDDVQLKEKTLKNNIIGRQMVYQVFDDQGIEYLPSQTSFIFFKTDAFQKNVRKALQQRNVLIRDYRHSPGWARVSIGTPNEMEVFLDEITNLI